MLHTRDGDEAADDGLGIHCHRRCGREAADEHGHSPDADRGERRLDGGGGTGCLDGDVDAFDTPDAEPAQRGLEGAGVARVDRRGGSEPPRQSAPLLGGLADDHRRAAVGGDRGRRQAHDPRTGDEDDRAGQRHLALGAPQRRPCCGRPARGGRGDARRDALAHGHDRGAREHVHVAVEAAAELPVRTDALVAVGAQVTALLRQGRGAAVAVAAADRDRPDHAITECDRCARHVEGTSRADRHHPTDAFVAEHHRCGGGSVTGGDVHVGAAEGGELDGDDHAAGGQQAPGHRHRLEGRTDARPHFRDRGGA